MAAVAPEQKPKPGTKAADGKRVPPPPAKKGEVRNPWGPKGKPGSAKQLFRQTLAELLELPVSKKDTRTRMVAVGEALINQALSGNVKAINLLMERVDGRVPQQLKLENDPDNPVVPKEVHWVVVPEGALKAANGAKPNGEAAKVIDHDSSS